MKKIIKPLLLTLLFSTGIQANKLEDIKALLVQKDGPTDQSLAVAIGLDKAFMKEFDSGIAGLKAAHLPAIYRLPEGFKKADVLIQYNRLRICYSTGSCSKMLSPTQKDRAQSVNKLLCDLLLPMADLDEDESEDGCTARKAEGIRVPA